MATKIQWEAQEQKAIFQWIFYNTVKYPELQLLFHIPNGGYRNRNEAVNLKRQGVKAGVPDLFLPVSRNKYHGLFIELKAKDGKATKEQQEWITNLRVQSYAAEVCHEWREAVECLCRYLDLQ